MSETAPMPTGGFYNIDRSEGRYSRESFGHQSEAFIAESLADLPSIKAVEMATEEEDLHQKVDFWLQFADWDTPIGVQLSLSHDPRRMAQKISGFPKMVTKQDSPESTIKGEGKNCCVVLVTGRLSDFGEAYNRYLALKKDGQNVKPGQIIPQELQADIYRQIITGYASTLKKQDPHLHQLFLATIEKNSHPIH